MEQILYPICCACIIFESNEKIIFRTFSGKRCTFKSNLDLILQLLQKSTGILRTEEIAYIVSKKLGISTEIVIDAIEDLAICEIIMDSHKQFMKYHTLTYNPSRYPAELSLSEIDELTQTSENYITREPLAIYDNIGEISLPIFDVLHKRHSCRNFLKRAVEVEKIFAICKASYSTSLCPVASAGGLYPLTIYFVNRIPSKQLPSGLYQYNPQEEQLLLLETEVEPERIQYSLNDQECIFEAPCIFFVCADIERHMKKYSNSGYRYTLLEIGHVVQNMTIVAGEMGLGGVEYGGFCDEAVKRMFQMSEVVYPFACYSVGYKDVGRSQNDRILQIDQEKRIIEKIVRDKITSISSYLLENEQFKQSDLRVVVSKFEDSVGRLEFATGVNPAYGSAYMKSVMEAYERYILSDRYCERIDSADRLGEKYLDPREYVPYSDAQRKENGFAEFRTDDTIEWLRGYDQNGNVVYVPVDLCFYVSDENKMGYHAANSSGCAAHFDLNKAKQVALLELIERDAIMRNWIYRQVPYKVDEKEISNNIKRRLRNYRKQDVSVFILLLPSEYAYTVLVCSVKDLSPPYFVAGAGASFSSVKEAVVKAFNEWEVSFVLGENNGDSDVIAPEEVVSPQDHGDLYRYTNYNKEVGYLLKGKPINISEVSVNRLGNIAALNPVFVVYRPLVDGAYMVRAFSKELIPINFGYGMDFFNHFKVNKQLVNDYKFPHYFS